MLSPVPPSRIRALNARPFNPRGDFVLYWMIAARRTRWNFALQHAVTLCRELRAPLLILEALDTDYPWANDRIHRFVLDGMAANAAACRRSRAVYYPFVERKRGAGGGLIAALSRHACAVVADHFPAFLVPGVTRAAAHQSAVRLEAVDSNGRIPLSAHGRAFTTARSFRAFLQRELRSHLREFPDEHPLRGLPRGRRATVPSAVARRWQAAGDLLDRRSALGALPTDQAEAEDDGVPEEVFPLTLPFSFWLSRSWQVRLVHKSRAQECVGAASCPAAPEQPGSLKGAP